MAHTPSPRPSRVLDDGALTTSRLSATLELFGSISVLHPGGAGRGRDEGPFRGRRRDRLRRLRPAAAGRRAPGAAHDRPADGRERLPRPRGALRGPHRRRLRPARARPQHPQRRPRRERPGHPGRGPPRPDRRARRRAGGRVREQRGSGDRPAARHRPSRGRGDPRGPRAADQRRAARRGGRGPGEPKQFRDAYQAKGWGHGMAGFMALGIVAGRVHRRVLRPAGARPRHVRHADRGRRVARRPAALGALPRP